MNKEKILRKTQEYVMETLKEDKTGHDWYHIKRVYNTAKEIQRKEGGDLFVVKLGALMHDIADWKFSNGDEYAGGRKTREWLEKNKVSEYVIKQVVHIVDNISYKGANVENKIQTLEGKIVQDADRLDALGAMGIARAFVYGGKKKRLIHNPNIKPVLHNSPEAYKNYEGTTINHFYEKILLIKDMMNTETGKVMANERHNFVELYLNQFYKEWKGKL